MHEKHVKPTTKTTTPDPELTQAAAGGDPMAVALAAEVAKEEAHPATKTAMAARAVREETVPADLVRSLLSAGGHKPHCASRENSLAACSCGWGAPAAELEELLGIGAAKRAKAAEDMEAHRVKAHD